MSEAGVDASRHDTQYHLPEGFEHCSKLKPVEEAATALDRVKAVVDVLYSPGGCPWDGKQTNESLLKNLLEETYEYIDAVETHDRDNMREELGDVLLQSVFQARVCESDAEDPFDIDEVADRLVNKLITRHPHVFAADDSAGATDTGRIDGEEASDSESPEAVLALWEKMKQQEKHRKSVLEGISRAQGALPRAAKVVSRISKSPNAAALFKAFDESERRDGQSDDGRQSSTEQNGFGAPSTGSEGASAASKADAYADEILNIVRRARIDGIDIESALRNRFRDVESRVAAIESETIHGGDVCISRDSR
ncbi:MazG family protein [Bifidobacterium miconisargentati]|uniref:MazG family protein n=1 Tax=Bifidobacterium miconisargentati TaxID=2834437 RepID=UPI001BDDA468|nr:MazG family protein [Bifidobacterium miconisargentati]MBW3090573.1 MazG family protein [Bifidobacterium miconisargentati]